MSTSLSPSSQKQSRDRILNTFHEITGFNIEDCIHFLHQYNWKLQDVVDAYYNNKEFKGKFTKNSTVKSANNGHHHAVSAPNPNLGNAYAKNNKKIQQNDDDDYYYAVILQQYGDADESARTHLKTGSHHQQRNNSQQKLKQNDKNFIYHEKQEFLRCGIHSLNNLFQIPHLFTHKHLDSIVQEFDKKRVNNDYGTLWIGDYDLSVLIEAINRCGYQVQQINLYNGESLSNRPWDSYFGLLININGAHWLTIKNVNGIYYNLDSTFSKPKQIGQKKDLVDYLIRFIQKFQNVYIFTVLK
ncbi:unnamed protein product [Adineta steineri]|uniref:ubiquitinyl hydrolase 1 n=1 Tax=Adineta steineri TaxID=433720 RepID=A0A819AVH9_9BILA|nr:unnamed protein product [Adineta steineri]CAF3793655.1 unnamed protein product [Adineta steineri]